LTDARLTDLTLISNPMRDGDEQIIPHSNEAFGLEVRGFDHIPEAERNMTLPQVDVFWVANSVNLFSFALGALAACVVGSITYVYVSLGSIVSVRAGLPVSTLTRAAFGMRGNLLNATLSWIVAVAFEVINTIFGVEALLALFQLLGWTDPGNLGKLVAVVLQLMLCGGIAVLGHATMVWFQRFFAVLVSAALIVVIAFTVGKIDLAHAAGTAVGVAAAGMPATAAHATRTWGAAIATFLTAAAVIASNPLSFLFNGPDWVRYLPSATPGRKVFWHVFWCSFIPSLALTMMGAISATLGDMSDPVAGLKPFIPAWLFIVYIFAVVGGSLANNVPTYYSSGLSLQSMGLKVHRNVATVIDVILSTMVALYILFVQDFSSALNNFIALLVVWVGPFGGVWICDGFMRRGKFDFRAIHSTARSAGRYWGWNGFNLSGYIALLAGMTTAAMTMMSPLYNGPIAIALGGADLSWLLGLPSSALVYFGLTKLNERRAQVTSLAAE
jgi:NCS1 family nucleobase:cation symporter-1